MLADRKKFRCVNIDEPGSDCCIALGVVEGIGRRIGMWSDGLF